jgi:hypothetical protein
MAALGVVDTAEPIRTPVLVQSEFDVLNEAAAHRWAASGLASDRIVAMRKVAFATADLRGVHFAEVAKDRITIDRDARRRLIR